MVTTFEVYMRLIDPKRLARLMVIQGVTQRELAAAAGWTAHSYLWRLLNNKVTTCEPEHAVRIATYLGVDVGDLFVPRATTAAGQIGKQRSRKQAAA
jgi:transcriptional regulator with XRE-family HTH domain